MQLFGQRHQVNRLLALAEIRHALEDPPVLVQEKILDAQVFQSGVQSVIVEQDRAQHGALGLQVLREGTFECAFSSHLLFAFCSLYVPHPRLLGKH